MKEIDDFLKPPGKPKLESEPEEKQKLPGLFDYINDLTFGKMNLARKIEADTGKFPSEFVPYIALKAFGNYRDTVLLANEINIRFSELSAPEQYDFYLYAIPKRKRFSKFYSADTYRESAIRALSKYFGWGSKEAEANLKMYSKEEIDELIRRTTDAKNNKTGRK